MCVEQSPVRDVEGMKPLAWPVSCDGIVIFDVGWHSTLNQRVARRTIWSYIQNSFDNEGDRDARQFDQTSDRSLIDYELHCLVRLGSGRTSFRAKSQVWIDPSCPERRYPAGEKRHDQY